jgi:hypothetical protein
VKTSVALAAQIAGMKKMPTHEEWAEMHKCASENTIKSVKGLIDGDTVKISTFTGRTTFAKLTEEQKEVWKVSGVADTQIGTN